MITTIRGMRRKNTIIPSLIKQVLGLKLVEYVLVQLAKSENYSSDTLLLSLIFRKTFHPKEYLSLTKTWHDGKLLQRSQKQLFF